MKEVTLHPTQIIDASDIERLCADAALTCTMKGALRGIPSNIHWHYKRGKEKGVLEITLMLTRPEIICSYKDNRGGEWIDDVIALLSASLL